MTRTALLGAGSGLQLVLKPPMPRTINAIRILEGRVMQLGDGIAYPNGNELTVPSLRVIQPSRKEIPYVPPTTVTVDQGAAPVLSDPTSSPTL